MLKRAQKADDLADVKLAAGNDNVERSANLLGTEQEEMRLGLLLIAEGYATQDQIQAALWQSRVTAESLGSTLVSQQVLRNADLMGIMERFDSAQISSSLQWNVPVDNVDLLRRERVAIFGMSEKKIYLACMGKERAVRADFERQFPDKELVFLGVKPQTVDAFLQRLDRLPVKTEAQATSFEDGRIEIVKFISDMTSDSDVLDLLVNLAGVRGGSDIHIEPKARSYTAFVRINRIRVIVHEGSLTQYNALRAQVKDRARMDAMEQRKPQDGAYSQDIMGRMFDLRVATYPLNGRQEKIVIRLLDPDKASRRLDDLGITSTEEWRKACGYSHGLIIVAGKTNSGKSTTLIASLREQDRIGKSIYTIEDPVEHRVDFLTQMSVNRAPNVGLDFKTGTRAMMRGDPEIILIGEIRDEETAMAAVQAAESGHLVFSTLHAGTVAETVNRLKHFGIDQSVLQPILRGVLAQRLIRTLCPLCRGAGCVPCMRTGYAGMTVVSEMGFFPSEKHVARMMNGEKFWKPMILDALHKIESGQTDEREIYRVFRSEIDHLNTDYEGVQELADRVLDVVHNDGESMVSREPLRDITEADRVHERQVAEISSRLSVHSVRNSGFAPILGSDSPYEVQYGDGDDFVGGA